MEILDKAYDNPGGACADLCGAARRAGWISSTRCARVLGGSSATRTTSTGVKIVAEEAISLKWQVDEYSYSVPANFRRLKDLGYETREELARFMEFLPALVEVTEYDLDEIARLLSIAEPPLAGPEFTVANVKAIARA